MKEKNQQQAEATRKISGSLTDIVDYSNVLFKLPLSYGLLLYIFLLFIFNYVDLLCLVGLSGVRRGVFILIVYEDIKFLMILHLVDVAFLKDFVHYEGRPLRIKLGTKTLSNIILQNNSIEILNKM